ncbi:hypothetical protein ACIQY5_21560 [Peribacillus frigoritolerans]|uniref:hypothetical protein n=1 Tax=Peribacillus frigoritolerans TaxID=450367 RepID=UPI0038251FB5
MENENWGAIEGGQIKDNADYSIEPDNHLNRAPFEHLPNKTLDQDDFKDTTDRQKSNDGHKLNAGEMKIQRIPFSHLPNKEAGQHERTENIESQMDDYDKLSDEREHNENRIPFKELPDAAFSANEVNKEKDGISDVHTKGEKHTTIENQQSVEAGQDVDSKPRNEMDSINDSGSGEKLETMTARGNPIEENETIQKVNDSHIELKNNENDQGRKPFEKLPGPDQNELHPTQKGKEHKLEDTEGIYQTKSNKGTVPNSKHDLGNSGKEDNEEMEKGIIQEDLGKDSMDTEIKNTDSPIKEIDNEQDAKSDKFTEKYDESREISEQNIDVDKDKENNSTDLDSADRNSINKENDHEDSENTMETGEGTETEHDREINDQSQEPSEENGPEKKDENKKGNRFNFSAIKETLSKKFNDPKLKESIRKGLDKYGWLFEKNEAFPIYRREMEKRIVELSDFTTENLVKIIDSILNTVKDLDHKGEKPFTSKENKEMKNKEKQYTSLKDRVKKKRRDPNSTYTLEHDGKGNKPRLREYKRPEGSNIFTSFGEGISDKAKRASSQNMKRIGTHPLFTGAKIQTHSGRDFNNRNIAYDPQQDYMKIPVELASDPKEAVPTLCKGIGYRAVNRDHHDNSFAELLEHQKLSLNKQQWSEFENAVDPIWEMRNGAQVPNDLLEFENVLGNQSQYSRQRFNEEMFALGSGLMLKDDVAADQPTITDRDKLFFVVREFMKYIFNRLRNKDPRSKLEFMKDLYKNVNNI